MFFIGIAGGSGSGKSTFAKKIVSAFSSKKILHICQDSYYLPKLPHHLLSTIKPNYDHPDAFDWPLLKSHIQDLSEGKSIALPIYDYTKSTRLTQTQKLQACDVCVLDGIFALWDDEIRAQMNLKVFVDVDADIRFIRRLHRDVRERDRTLDSIITQYYDTVRPMHRQFLEPTRRYADLIVGEEMEAACTALTKMLKTILKE